MVGLVLVRGVGWRVEVGGEESVRDMYICETPYCGITYFDARCFSLHLDAHGGAGGLVQQVSPHSHPQQQQQWKRALATRAALEEQQSMSMQQRKPVLAKLLEANPMLAKKLDQQDDATSFLLTPQSAAFVSCLARSYLQTMEYLVQGEDGKGKEEAMRLLQAWNSESWCQRNAERHGHVQNYRNWIDGTWVQAKADEIMANWRHHHPDDEEVEVAAPESEQEAHVSDGAAQSVDGARGRKRKKKGSTSAGMTMLHFGKARWKLLTTSQRPLLLHRFSLKK